MPRNLSARSAAPHHRTGRARLVSAAAAFAAGLPLLAAPAQAAVADEVTLDVVGITDFHGALEQAPFLDAQIDQIRTSNPNTVFVSAGDNIGGSTYASAIQQDEPTIDVLNAMALQTSAVGNHEFDQGYADLAGRVSDLADWEYLGANVEGETPDLPSTDVWTSPDGVRVGFVGTVTDETARLVSRDGIAGITFADEATTTNTYAAQLKAADAADIVVALVHAGATQEMLTALDADVVDAVFTGHTHVAVDEDTPLPVIQGGASGANLSRMTLTYDTVTGEVTGAVGENIAIDTATMPASADIQAIVDEALAEADVLGQETVGTVTAPLNRGSDTGVSDGSNRGTESPLGNLLGEVAKWTAERVGLEPDFGIINPGGLRADLDPDGNGAVTYAEAFTTQPFGNTIGTIDLTGAQVVTMLEQQFQPDQDRKMLRLGLSADLNYVYDPAAAQGEHITAVTLDGAPLDPAATYTVASNTFLLSGQDGFTVFTEGAGLQETGIVDLQGLVDFLAGNPGITPDYTQRSVGVTASDDAPAAGEELTLALSSLAFTTTEPKPTEVSVSSGSEVLATTTEIDTTIVPGLDETGRATVSFVVPAGTSTLSITTDLGTAVSLPLVVEEPEPVAGTDTLAVRQGNRYSIFNTLTGGEPDQVVTFGERRDTVLVGDWDGDGTDTPAVRQGNRYSIFNSLTGAEPDQVLTLGERRDTVLVGDWDGNGTDTLAVR
ncbi:MAG: bifunctional metallophosphatase/5'-nucleotidase, partial [Georgenia sp.]